MKPDEVLIKTALSERGHTLEVHTFETLGSTNAWLSEHDIARGVCITDHQPAGRGRRGRVWDAVAGNITFSIAQTMDVAARTISQVPLVTGIACAEALRAGLGIDVQVKWPNDLLVNGEKLGGLLHESAARPGGQRVIGGIGVNLVDDSAVIDSTSGRTSLGAKGISSDRRDELVAMLAVAVLDAWEAWAQSGWSAFADRWSRVDALVDVPVRVFSGLPGDGGASFDGRACGVDQGGALQVQTPDGEVHRVQAGDVSVRPRHAGAC